MAITYDAPNNTITVTTDYSDLLTDIWNADQAGGWGVVSKQGTHQFEFDCKLKLGDGSTSTTLSDQSKQAVFKDGIATVPGTDIVRIFNNATVTFGTLIDATEKLGENGVQIIWLESTYFFRAVRVENGGKLYLYGCDLTSTIKSTTEVIAYNGSTTRLYNCLINGIQLYGYGFDVFDVTMMGGTPGVSIALRPLGTEWVLEQVLATDYYYGYYTKLSAGVTLRNAYFRQNTYQIIASSISANSYFVNPDFDVWNILWGGTCTAEIYRQYTFNLKVMKIDQTPINGATVTLKDKDDNEIFSVSTDAQGNITEQTVSRGYYDQANGDTLQEYSPHVLTIFKEGYDQYEIKFTLDEPIDWRVALAVYIPKCAGRGSAVSDHSVGEAKVKVSV